MLAEMNVWENQWVDCIKQLNQWDVLKVVEWSTNGVDSSLLKVDIVQDFANHQAVHDPLLLGECVWRMPQWQLMKDALSQVTLCYPVVFN